MTWCIFCAQNSVKLLQALHSDLLCSQAEKRNTDLEDKLQTLQAQLSTQDLELTELRVNSQAAAAHAASKASKSQSNKEQEGLKAMQATTRNVLLAQVCCAEQRS